MDHESLRAFLRLADTLHFGRASRRSNLSPSALSRIILRLEEEVGQKLFIRDNRSVELTAAGVEFRTYAQEVLDGWDRLRGGLERGRQTLSGELRLYSSVAASYTVLSELLGKSRLRYPGIHIRLQTGDPAEAVEKLGDGGVDITVAARPDSLPRNLVFKTVAVTPLVFIAPGASGAAASDAYSLTARSPVPWDRVPLVFSESGLSRSRADAWFRKAGIKPNVYAEVSGHEAVVSMVRLGFGVGIAPKIVVDRFSLKGEVKVLDVEPALEPYIVGLCTHKRRLESPVVRAFWNIISD
jgi:LysR family positive regulator for ilvC